MKRVTLTPGCWGVRRDGKITGKIVKGDTTVMGYPWWDGRWSYDHDGKWVKGSEDRKDNIATFATESEALAWLSRPPLWKRVVRWVRGLL